MAISSTHALVDIVEHRFLEGTTGIAAGVDEIVCVDDSDDVLELVDPRFFNKGCSIPFTREKKNTKIRQRNSKIE
jgi:hypothetical protein